MLEKDIEEKVGTYAKGLGFLVYKFTSPNRAAVPDRMYIHPEGYTFFIEFKRGGAKPTVPQAREHARLRGHHKAVHVIDDVAEGKRLILEIFTKHNRFDVSVHRHAIRELIGD